MSLQYKIVPVTPFQQNCSIIWCDETHQAAIIDPGGDIQQLQQVVEELGVNVTQLLLTHGHLDHVGGTEPLFSDSECADYWPHSKMMNFGCKDYLVKVKCLASQ